MNQFGVIGKMVLNSLPQLSLICGHRSTTHRDVLYYKPHRQNRSVVFSRNAIAKLRRPGQVVADARHGQSHIADHTIKPHERYRALTPLVANLLESASQ